MASPHEAVLRERATELIQHLGVLHLTGTLDETSWRDYHVKINLKQEAQAVGQLVLYYSPAKRVFSLVEREVKAASAQRLARQAFEKGGQAATVKPPKKTTEEALPTQGVVAYVDGSFINGRVGYGALILRDGEAVTELCGRVQHNTESHQIAGELTATMEVVRYCEAHGISQVQIVYDYVGIEKWAKRQWKANLPLTQAYQAFMQATSVKVRFTKVQSHTGNTLNDAADALARKGALQT